MATPYETFVNTELPRRVAVLTKEMCSSYEGDPNDPTAPAILQGAPKGTFYLRNSNATLWWKSETGTFTWEIILDVAALIATNYKTNKACSRTDGYHYELPDTPVIGSVTVAYNGLIQDSGDYTISGTTLTFIEVKEVSDKVTANYWIL